MFDADVVPPPLHHHQYNLLVYIHSGKVSIQTQNGLIPLQPGDFFFTPAYAPHTEVYEGVATTVHILKVPDALLLKPPKQPTALSVPSLFKSLYKEIFSWGKHSGSFTSDQKRVIDLFKTQLAKAKEIRQFNVTFPSDGPMLKIAKQILKNPKEANDLNKWAERASMSRRSFSDAFKEATGLSFNQWCLKLKIAVAVQRILDGKDIKNIAYDLGFTHPSHFISTFKAQTGLTPKKLIQEKDFWHLSIGIPDEKEPEKHTIWVNGTDLYSHFGVKPVKGLTP